MTTLSVDRLHARYVLDRPSAVGTLDAGLRRVVAEELDIALLDVALPSADHICIPSLTMPVRLDPDAGSSSIARAWAAQIVAALRTVIADGAGVQVYPRTLDALVDLAVSLGRGDPRRAWAWSQVGLLGDPAQAARPREAVAAALVGHPALAPAALIAAAARGPVGLTVAGWVSVAAAVQRLVTAPDGIAATGSEAPVTGPGTEPVGPGYGDGPDRDDRRSTVAHVLGAPVTRLLPDADLPVQQRRALASLAVVCAAPSLARSGPVVGAVAEALSLRSGRSAGAVPEPGPPDPMPPAVAEPDPSPADGAARGQSGRPGARERVVPDPAGPDPARGTPGTAAPGQAGPGGPGALVGAAAISDVGGALFLLRAIDELGLAEESASAGSPLATRPVSWVVTSLAEHLTGAPADDAAIRALSGPVESPARPPDDAEGVALGALVARIEDWLRARLRLEPDDDLTHLWRRRAAIVAEPGWVEVEFSLADVDTAVRLAGLDLDPGFVWWLGAVVRFRYA